MKLIIGSNRMQEVEGVTAAYPYVLNRADSRHIRVPWHWHEEVEFSLIRQGRLRVTLSGRQYTIQPGEGFFLNANVLHAMEPADPGEAVVWDSHMLHPMLLGGFSKSLFDTKYVAPVLRNKRFDLIRFSGETQRQQSILELLRQVTQVQGTEFEEFQTRNLFSEIWLLLLQEMRELEQQSGALRPVSQERIRMMLEYIHEHYREKLTLEQIAAAAIVSERECLRCFRSCIGKTPFAYLVDYRLQMAEQLLRTTEKTITEIALDTGFSGSAYFTKLFRELRKMTPSQYRKACKNTETEGRER